MVLLFPLTTHIILHNMSVKKLEENIKSSNMSIISNCVETIDILLGDIKSTSAIISSDKDVSSFLRISSFEGPHQNTILLLSLIEKLKNIKHINNNIIDIYVHSQKSDALFSSTSFFDSTHGLYSSSFSYTNDLKYTDWKEQFFYSNDVNKLKSLNNMSVSGINQKNLIYSASIPNDAVKNRMGTVFLFIDINVFERNLKDLNIDDMGYFYVTDKSGNLFYSKGNYSGNLLDLSTEDKSEGIKEFKDNKKTYFCIWKKSEISGLLYTAYIPKSFIMEQVYSMKQLIIITVISSAIIAILLALFISKNNSKPIDDIISLFSDRISLFTCRPQKYTYSNILESLKGNINEVIATNCEIENKLKEQQPVIHASIIQNLLSGDFSSSSEIVSLLKSSTINLNGFWHSVIIIRIRDSVFNSEDLLAHDNKIKMILTDIVLQAGASKFGSINSHYLGKNQIAFILSYNFPQQTTQTPFVVRDREGIKEFLQDFAALIYNTTLEKTSLKVVISIGEPFSEQENISTSYYQAKHIMQNISVSFEKPFYYFTDLAQINYDFYYPFDIELRLSNCVQSGDINGVEQLLKIIYMENFIKKSLTYNMKSQLFHSLNTTLIRSANNANSIVNFTIFDTKHQSTQSKFDEMFDLIISEYKRICQIFIDQKNEEVEM